MTEIELNESDTVQVIENVSFIERTKKKKKNVAAECVKTCV